MYLHGFAIGFFVLAGYAISDHLVFIAEQITDDFKEANMKTTVRSAEDEYMQQWLQLFTRLWQYYSSALPLSIIFKSITVISVAKYSIDL